MTMLVLSSSPQRQLEDNPQYVSISSIIILVDARFTCLLDLLCPIPNDELLHTRIVCILEVIDICKCVCKCVCSPWYPTKHKKK